MKDRVQKIQHSDSRPPAASTWLRGDSLQRKCDSAKIRSGTAECDERGKNSRVDLRQFAPAERHRGLVREGAAPSIVYEVLRSPGRPLDSAARTFFEPRFGHDFSRVRVHDDARAAQSARSVHAAAYTVGHDIVMGAGRYAPESSEGRSLLAHELTHTIQQAPEGALPATATSLEIGSSDTQMEREAVAVAAHVMAGGDDGHASIGSRPEVSRTQLTLARTDCSTLSQKNCKSYYKCGHGNSGRCGWTYGSCKCLGASKPSEPGGSNGCRKVTETPCPGIKGQFTRIGYTATMEVVNRGTCPLFVGSLDENGKVIDPVENIRLEPGESKTYTPLEEAADTAFGCEIGCDGTGKLEHPFMCA